VYGFDCLACQLLVQLTMTDRLDKVGARVLSTSEPDVDGPDELRDLIRNILGSIAAYERAVIRGRMMAGRRPGRRRVATSAASPASATRPAEVSLSPTSANRP